MTQPAPLLDSALVAHGVGARQDLPIPFTAALIGAAVVLLATFILLGVLWRKPRLAGGAAGYPIPWLDRVVTAPWFIGLGRVIGLFITGWVAAAALFGKDDAINPTAGAFYVLFWVGILAFLSVLFGPVWRWLNPLRSIHWVACWVLRSDSQRGLFTYPERLGSWPAVVTLTSYVWLELCAPDRATLPVLRVYFAAYIAVALLGAAFFGARWFAEGDGFEAYSTLMGRLSVFGRRDDGVLVIRNPLDGLVGLAVTPGLTAFVLVLLGSTAFDGLSNSPAWITRVQPYGHPVLAATLGLAATMTLIAVVYVIATRLSGMLGHGPPAPELPGQFAHTIVPIALGYIVAHYYTLLVVVGQQTARQLSDPLGTGADLLGIAERGISYSWTTPTLVATIQVSAVVIGHVLGVVLAHERAVRLFPHKTALVGQLPLLAVMVAYTLGGLLLLFAA